MAGFTQEEYEKAKEVDLLDYLMSNGYNLKKVGTNEYTLKEHDSMRINPIKNTFFWNSRNVGGSTIQFLQHYEGKTLVEAIKTLNGESITNYIKSNDKPKIDKDVLEEEKGDLILPERNENNKRAIAYLTQARKIDHEIVNSLIKSGNIYESKEKHNIVFLGMDKENIPKYAMQRSTLTNSSYKGDCENSDKNFGIRLKGKDDSKVYIFESAIDMMTHATISKHLGKDWKFDNRVSLGCLSFKAMDSFLEDNRNIKELVLFLDNDDAGEINRNKLYRQYGNDYKISIVNVKNKDLNQTWQDYLKDKDIDSNVKFNSYISYVEKPFLPPKLKENQDQLVEYICKMLIDENIKTSKIRYLFNSVVKNSCTLAETQDDKAIILIKDEEGVEIGGYEFDIYNKDYELKPLPKTKEEPILFLGREGKEVKENGIFLHTNIITPLYWASTNTCNTGYTNNIEDLSNIDFIMNKTENIKTIVLCPEGDIDFKKQAKDENSQVFKALREKEEKYGIKIVVEEWEKDLYKSFLKEDYIKKPFIPKEVGNNEELYSLLLQKSNIPKNRLIEMFKENHIYQDVDRNMVFLAKDENGQNIGGYSLDIYNKAPQLKKLENTYISKDKEIETINFATYILKNTSNSLEIEQVEEMEI